MKENGEFDAAAYGAEARERWGDTPAYRESTRRTKSYGETEWSAIRAEADAIMAELAALQQAGQGAEEEPAMDAAERHRRHIDRWFYRCSPAQHAGLADMYTADERFGAYFEERGKGLTGYVAAAIRANARRAK